MSMSLLLGWGLTLGINSARLCAKKAGGGGGLCARGAYLRDTTVHQVVPAYTEPFIYMYVCFSMVFMFITSNDSVCC